jgi:hypothetical protein
MEIKSIIDEDPIHAWPEEYIRVKDRVVLDLGCGFFGKTDQFKKGTMEWEGIKLPNMVSTAEYFLSLGAKKVIGIDSNQEDINWLTSNVGSERALFFNETITSPQQVIELITKYNIEIVKADIEGYETNLLSINDDVFKLVKEYYIETHTLSIHDNFLKQFEKCNYKIREMMAVGKNSSLPLVIFACQI